MGDPAVNKIHRNTCIQFVTASLILVSVAGCAAFGLSDKVDPTLSSMSTAVALTATAAEQNGQSVNELATAQVKGTQKSQEILVVPVSGDIRLQVNIREEQGVFQGSSRRLSRLKTT